MRRNERERIERQLKEFAERLKDAAGSNLRSVVLYGSAATSNFYEDFSDVNVLALLQDLSAPAMLALSETVQWWKKQNQAIPLFLSVEELTRAADVFAIELLDMRSHHKVIYGEDLIGDLDIPMRLHRIQVEHELRTKLILLRQNFVNKVDVRKLMLDSVSSLMTLFRHSLIAMGEEAEQSHRAMLQQLQGRLNLDTRSFSELLNVREGSIKSDAFDAKAIFPAYLRTIEQVISAVDRL
jgi:predicted nucleotidyltransferase